MGALSGNKNAMTHGLRTDVRFPLGKLAPDLRKIEQQANGFRRSLEAAVMVKHGKIDFRAAAAISTAARWERHALLAQRWLKLRGDVMKDADRLRFSESIAQASGYRDKCIDRLRLDVSAGDIFDSLYGPDALTDEPIEPEAEPTTEAALDGKPEDEKGKDDADGS